MGDDIDVFIQQQKQKLIQERSQLDNPKKVSYGGRSGSVNNESDEEENVLPLGHYEDKRKQLQEERKKEYNQMLEKNYKENIPPSGQDKDDGGGGLLAGLGSYEEKRRRLQAERKKEYNNLLAEKKVRTGGQVDKPPNGYVKQLPVVSPPQEEEPQPRRIRERHSAEATRSREREREWEFTREDDRDRGYIRRNRSFLSDEDDEDFHRSRPPAKKGWATPTYEEILEKKRLEEKAYRRYDDLERYPDRGRYEDGYLRPAKSDGHINRYDDRDRPFRELDRDYEPRRVRFQGDNHRDYPRERDRSRRRDDDNLLEMITQLKLKYGADLVDEVTQNIRSKEPSYGRRRQASPSPPPRRSSPPLPRRQTQSPPPTQRAASPPRRLTQSNTPRGMATPANNQFAATLLVGKENRMSADMRKKEEYRRELERQIEEAKKSKMRARDDDRNAGPGQATIDMNTRSPPTRRHASPPPARVSPREQRPPPAPAPQYTPPVLQPPAQDLGRYGVNRPLGGGILDGGWGGEMYRAQPYASPPVQNYGSPGLGQPYMSPLDEAYFYYANRNPLDPGVGSALTGPSMGLMGAPRVPEPPSQPRLQPAEQPYESSMHRSPRGADPRLVNRNTARGGIGLAGDAEDDSKKSRVEQQRLYQEELRRQMEEQKEKKKKMKEEEERYNKKIEEEIKNYDPYGRGGGGAPMRDNHGNIIANRKPGQGQENSNAEPDRRQLKDPSSVNNTPRFQTAPPVDYPTLDSTTDSPPDPNAPNFARGGNGIFGEPKTNKEKTQQQKYQEELRLQMEEKKRRQQEEKKRQEEEERHMMQKIQEDQDKILRELEEEKRKEREKAEAAQKQQEELKRQQDERKKDEERKKKEAEEKRLEELRRQQDEDRRQREQERAQRIQSPVIPALRNKERDIPQSPPIPTLQKSNMTQQRYQTPEEQDTRRLESPPVPTLRKQERRVESPLVTSARKQSDPSPAVSRRDSNSSNISRVPSADVLKQLAKMRQQLQSERERVENNLNKEKVKPTVYDSRLPSKGNKEDVDVFEISRKPVSVRRGKDTSRISTDNREFQQRLRLKKQEEELANIKSKKSPYELQMPGMDPKDLGIGRAPSVLSANMLDSESAFIDSSINLHDSRSPSPVSNGTYTIQSHSPSSNATYTIHNDDQDVPNGVSRAASGAPSRSDTPKANGYRKPSDRQQVNPMKVGSNVSLASLDPDAISRRNEQRLRKLNALSGDDISTGDPDDILERFMANQKHKRPPSGMTLQDDTWLNS